MAITKQVPNARARLTKQGQITVPKAVRDVMELQPGDHVEFELGEQVVVRRHRSPDILSFAGIAAEASDRLPESAEELDALIARIRRDRGTS